jgi:hypothetical protein
MGSGYHNRRQQKPSRAGRLPRTSRSRHRIGAAGTGGRYQRAAQSFLVTETLLKRYNGIREIVAACRKLSGMRWVFSLKRVEYSGPFLLDVNCLVNDLDDAIEVSNQSPRFHRFPGGGCPKVTLMFHCVCLA